MINTFKLFSLLFFVLTLGNFVSAQDKSISGTIMSVDSVALSGVMIHIKELNKTEMTNANGYYSFDGLENGIYTLTTSMVGYLPRLEEINLSDESKSDKPTVFFLKEEISVLPTISVMTRGNEGLKDIPGSVTYLSPTKLAKYNYTDINRVLRDVPGVNVQEEDGFGLFPSIGLRGTGVERNTKITVMEDGILIAPAPYAAPAAYYFPTVARMSAIEIQKGSSQIKYGPYTTGGAINLVSTPIPTKFGGTVNLIGGSFNGFNLQANAGASTKHVGVLVQSSHLSSAGFKQLDNGGRTGFNKADYIAKLRFNTKKDAKYYQSITFKAGHTTLDADETYLGLTQSDFDQNPLRRYAASQMDNIQTEQSQFSATHLFKFPKIASVTTTVYRTEFKRNWYKLNNVKDSLGNKVGIASLLSDPTGYNDSYDVMTGTSSLVDDALLVKANNRSYYSNGLQSVLNLKLEAGKTKHDIELGVRYHQDQIDRFQWIDEYRMEDGVMELTQAGTAGTESNRIGRAYALATYVQYKFKIGKFTATPGMRYENIYQYKIDYGKSDIYRIGSAAKIDKNKVDVVLPGIGLDYQFSKYLGVFAGVHKGFTPPGSKDGTNPEESVNYEFGTRYLKNSLHGQAVLFYNDYSNLLGADLEAAGGTGSGDLFNGGEVQSWGIEFAGGYDVLSYNRYSRFALPITLSYTFTDAKFLNNFDSDFDPWGEVESGDKLPYLANNQLSFSIGLQHKKFSLDFSGKYMGAMRTSAGQGEILLAESTDSYFVMDASATFNFQKNVSVFASATNISNESYIIARRPAGLRPGMPRAFNAGLKVRF